MSELFILENERAKLSAPIQYEELVEKYSPDIISRASAVHELYCVSGGKSRDLYMERLALEFKDTLGRSDLDLLDSYLEHRRWFK
jgi:hypothetical protein